MFERFTESARMVIVLAQEEARKLKHDHIGSEHLLLGVVREGDPAADLLIAHGAELGRLRAAIVEIVGAGSESSSTSSTSLGCGVHAWPGRITPTNGWMR